MPNLHSPPRLEQTVSHHMDQVRIDLVRRGGFRNLRWVLRCARGLREPRRGVRGVRCHIRNDVRAGPATAHRHVVFDTSVAFLQKEEIVTSHPGAVVEVLEPDRALSLELAHTFEVLGPVGNQFPTLLLEYHAAEELVEGRGLEVDRTVRSNTGSVVTFDSRSGDIGRVSVIRLDRFQPP